MTGIFLKVLELSLVGSYVILFVLAARWLLHKSPKWCSYLLWCIVFLRLILPAVPVSSFSLVPTEVWRIQSEQIDIESVEAIKENGAVSNDDISLIPPQTYVNTVPSTLEEATIHSTPNNEVEPIVSVKTPNEAIEGFDTNLLLQGLAYIWFVGAVFLGGYHTWSYYKFKHTLKDAVWVEPGIYEIQGGHVSFVLGLWKPSIYISDSLDADTRNVVLCHERVHLQRKDYLIKPAALAVSCVHWFNPLVWLAFSLMNKDCEMSCDEKVVSILGEESKKLYSYTLLDEATKGERLKNKRDNMCTVLSFGEESIKARIQHVLNFKKAPAWLIVGTVIVLIVLAVGLLSNRKPADYWASISMGCSAKEYVQTQDGAFLTLIIFEQNYNERELVIEVTDKELQNKLAETEPSDIIGVHLLLNVPEKILEKRHIDHKAVNGFYFLEDSYYDQYLTLDSFSLASENTVPVEKLDEVSEDITEYQNIPEEALKKWAVAFTDRDGNALYALSHDKEHFTMWDMVSALEGGYSFGDSSPWPATYDFEIEYTEGADTAVIRYWMRNFVPEVYPVEEKVRLVKEGDLYYIEHVEMISYHSIDTLEELKEAYVRDKDDINGNLERMGNIDCRWYDWTDNTGYDKDFVRAVFHHVANNTNPEYYDAYKDPVSAAKLMLNLGPGTGEVTEILHETDSQKGLGEGTYGVLGEGTVVNVAYVFATDGSTVQIPMVLAEESQGIWALSAGDFTKAYKYTKGALQADANFLAREIIDEINFSQGITYQISDYGIYEVSAEAFRCVYAQNMKNIKYDCVGEVGTCYLYYPVDSQYTEGALDTMYDSLCKVNLATGEAYTFPFEAARNLVEKASFNIQGGFVTLYNVPGSNGSYALPDARKVWKDKTTAELTNKEKDEYGTANREYILNHPDEVVVLGNRFEQQTDAFIDLDGDGRTEQIAIGKGEPGGWGLPYDSYMLKLDDWQEYRHANNLYNNIWAISPDGENIYIALYEDGPSGDPRTTFFRYYDGKLVEAGATSNSIYNLSMEDGIIHTYDRVDLIQTDFIATQYAFDEKGNLQRISQEIYDYVSYGLEDGFKLLKAMTLYITPGGKETFILQPQNVYFEQVDGSLKWMKLRGNNGQTGWFEVTGVCEVYGIDSIEWFEGLGFAG